ncbi:MAG: hypothetical protein J6U46_01885 [Bacteroidaceae bacterium]|nr:hypothetical protein [Bacteroidaceae bacterium]
MQKQGVTRANCPLWSRQSVGTFESTFRRYLNSRRDVLAEMGVSPRAQMLPPRAVKFVVEDYCIELPEKFR